MKKQGSTFVDDSEKPAEASSVAAVEPRRIGFEQTLKCKLTDAETLAYAREMADVNADITELETELKSLATEFKGKIALKEGRRETLAKYVSTGSEYRSVKCERVFDHAEQLVTEIRLDGQDPHIVGQRPMTQSELQQELALQD